jgi:DNA replication protein DnaC
MSNQSDVIDTLHGLGFRTSPESLRALIAQLSKTKASPAQAFESLALLERRERDACNLKNRTQAATLGNFKPLDRFDWNHPSSINRVIYEELCSLAFAQQGDNVLFRGTSGLGKTTLAQNLGHAALTKGLSVRFSTLAAILADLLKQESMPAFERRLKRYTLPDLLIIDEIGYLPCDSRSADLLYSIISRRHERASTVVTTNLAFKQWGAIFPGAACVVAMVDRFSQHCHVMDIEGDSWRQKETSEARPPQKRRR